MGNERWFITLGFMANRPAKWATNAGHPIYKAYIAEEHPAEFIQQSLAHKDGNYWIAFATIYTGNLPTGEIKLSTTTREKQRVGRGCGAPLIPGQWWGYCGETDMGQTLPALCTDCGGFYTKRVDG